MAELRRTKAGIFDEKTIISLYDFEAAVEDYKNNNPQKLQKMITPAEDALKQIIPSVEIDKRVLKSLYNGKPLFKQDIKNFQNIKNLNQDELFAVFCEEKFVEVAKRTNGEMQIARPFFVLN